MFVALSEMMEWFIDRRGSALPIEVKRTRKKALQLVHRKKHASVKFIAAQKFPERKSIKAPPTNHYAKLGYVTSCLLDDPATTLFQSNNSQLQVLRGLKDHSFKAHGLKVARRNAYAGGRILYCSRDEQKSVGMRVREKRKPRSVNLGFGGLRGPLKNKFRYSLTFEVLSWMIRKATLFISKTARHLYQKTIAGI